jgi:hypothetical protein
MQLKYHQATYDLLTQKPIETQRTIEQYTNHFNNLIRGAGSDHTRQEWEKHLTDALAWTKLSLYQHPIQLSEKNIQQLDTLEAKYQVKLPAPCANGTASTLTLKSCLLRVASLDSCESMTLSPFRR